MDYVFIAGYANTLSARPGETVGFCVSSKSTEAYTATLHRSICADPNPEGPGIIEEDASAFFPSAQFPSRLQHIYPGSYAETTSVVRCSPSSEVEMTCWFMPSLISGDNQTLLSWGEVSVLLNSAGQLCARIGDDQLLTGAETVRLRRWYHCTLRISADGALRLMLC